MKKIEIKFIKKRLNNVFRFFLRFKHIFYFAFFGLLFVFTFKIIYNAYVDIEYMFYEKRESKIITNAKMNNKKLKKIIYDLQTSRDELDAISDTEYNNPFEFRGTVIPVKEEDNKNFINSELKLPTSIKPK